MDSGLRAETVGPTPWWNARTSPRGLQDDDQGFFRITSTHEVEITRAGQAGLNASTLHQLWSHQGYKWVGDHSVRGARAEKLALAWSEYFTSLQRPFFSAELDLGNSPVVICSESWYVAFILL